MSISAVLVIKNEEKNLALALKSLNFVDEIVVFDMQSSDQSKAIARKFTDQVFSTPKDFGYADPARNLALSKASGDWILVLDADEEIPQSLAQKIQDLLKTKDTDVYFLPRKNLIFQKALKHSGWWPDYQARLFKKGMVQWQVGVHRQPDIKGRAEYLTAKEDWAIIHHNYNDVEDFVRRSQKYTSLQAQERKAHKTIDTQDLLEAFNAEFLRRFFQKKAHQDGMHGLALSLLQSNYELLIKLKQWQAQGFPEEQLNSQELIKMLKAQRADFNYWLSDLEINEAGFWRKIYLKLKRKFKI
jgi:glycosyltransferase involved in cell wall biosynthesis